MNINDQHSDFQESRDVCFQTCNWTASPSLHVGCFCTATSSISPHNRGKISARRPGDVSSIRRLYPRLPNILCLCVFYCWRICRALKGRLFHRGLEPRRMNPVCSCRLTQRKNKTTLPWKANMVLGTTAWIRCFKGAVSPVFPQQVNSRIFWICRIDVSCPYFFLGPNNLM